MEQLHTWNVVQYDATSPLRQTSAKFHSYLSDDAGEVSFTPRNFTPVVPQLYKDLYDAAVSGDTAKANELQAKNAALGLIYQKGRVLSQSLPALKVIMNELGLCGPSVLPPMIEPSTEEKADILKNMAEEGITK